jgi:hemolysin activation/secretion protein
MDCDRRGAWVAAFAAASVTGAVAALADTSFDPRPILRASVGLSGDRGDSAVAEPKALPHKLIASNFLARMPRTASGALLIAQASQAEAVAEPAAEGPLRFEIRGYRVDGNTLLKREEIDRALARFTGPQKDFGDVQRALEALQVAYTERGYAGVQITLPEQELDKGEVRFSVIENKIGKIVVEGNEHFDETNIRRTVPALVPGTTPNSRQIASSVRLANESPAKQTAVLLRAAEREGEVDAVVRVADVEPLKYSISLDNTGNLNTGLYRVGVAVQHANMFNRDHVLTAQYLTSPQNPNKVTVFGAGYRIPLYGLGDSIDLVTGYSDVDSGTVQDLFTVTGKGAVYAFRYNQSLAKLGEVEHKLTYGIDYRAYQNNVLAVTGGPNLVPDITVHPMSITYSGVLREPKSEISYYFSYNRNLPGGNDGKNDTFKGARADSRASYRIFRAGSSYTRSFLEDWQARFLFNMQFSEDALISGEQFGLGGVDSVRGFNERYTSNDKGYRTNLEIYTPDIAARMGLDNGRLRVVAFYDTGTVRRNNRQAGELRTVSLDSAGVGIRLNYRKDVSLRADYAQVIHDGSQTATPAGRTHANRWHFSLAYVY